jgi:hypothetical protein
MASNPDYYVTPEEYLAIERKADSKSEYVGRCWSISPGNAVIVGFIGRSHLPKEF